MEKTGRTIFTCKEVYINTYYVYGCGANYGNAKALLTGRSISDLTGRYTLSSYYYDDHNRLIQSHATNRMGGMEDDYYLYSFTGKILKKLHVHTDSISANNAMQ